MVRETALDHLKRVDQELWLNLAQSRVRDGLSVPIVHKIHLRLDKGLPGSEIH